MATMQAEDVLGVSQNFASLSTRDLLEARDLYHWHLIHKENVVGTAIGRYRIRKEDPWADRQVVQVEQSAAKPPETEPKPERTFENSEIRNYSWPCVLVLVRKWQQPADFTSGGSLTPDQAVPKTLYMPDGRVVPVCIVKVTQSVPDPRRIPDWQWPDGLIGGGFPVVSETQGASRIASVGCLVTDGFSSFALTSRHVVGPKGHRVSTIRKGRKVTIGRSDRRQLTRLPFSDVYVEFPGRRTFLTIDAGLIEVRDASEWTSQTYGLPTVGTLADLSEHNISVRLINAEVRAFGAASGELSGRIAALFYRYRSIGGYDDVADFLIAPEEGTASSQPGDSGTVWHLVQKDDRPLRPIAVQWGGQGVEGSGGEVFNFALASSLTNILRLLDVELVVDQNVAAQPYWGKTGHYSLAAEACEQTSILSSKLEKLLALNQDRISFPVASLDPKAIAKAVKDAKDHREFVPLADVPDVIWKTVPWEVTGGRDTSKIPGNKGPEHPTHHADCDIAPAAGGATLRELSLQNPHKNVTVPFWQQFYTSCGYTSSDKRGMLPFRCWQFFDAMVDALEHDDLVGYIAAAGLLAHYVGDACQPLHGSQYADGIPVPAIPGQKKPKNIGAGVHSAYESAMVDHRSGEILAGMQQALPTTAHPPLMESGQAVAIAVVRLMDRAAQAVDPLTLINAYAATKGGASKAVTSVLWDAFGPGTIATLCDGTVTLASIWESAWRVGGGSARFKNAQLQAVDRDALRARYEDPTFVRSLDLDNIRAVLKGHP
jgi:hypothetical protein